MAILFLAPVEDPELWLVPLRHFLPGREIRVHPAPGQAEDIDIALVAKPPPGVLAGLPNLKLVCSLWFGVDSLVADPTTPRHVPVIRLIDPIMTLTMTETVLAHVLAAHKELHIYRAQQAARTWRQRPQPRTSQRRVGILGAGELGDAAAQALVDLGFAVEAWGRRPRESGRYPVRTGTDGLAALLARSDILVVLLPLTDATRGILDAAAFAAMPPGAVLINLGRGPHLDEAALLAALERGPLAHAVLDVFHEEPLAADHPFWAHPKITLTPHVGAPTDPESAAAGIAETIRRFEAGEPLGGRVTFDAGY